MTRKLAWISMALLLVAAIYGITKEGLFSQTIWNPVGLRRFRLYAEIFWAIAGLTIWWRPSWLAPLIGFIVVSYTAWYWGIGAPLAVIYFLGSAWVLGRRLAHRANSATALLLGLAVWIFLISLAVHFPINTPAVYAIALAVPFVFGRRELAAAARAWRRPKATRLEAVALAVLLFVLAAQWLVALMPEVSSDGLGMHLNAAMGIARDSLWKFDYQNFVWALMPLGADWAYAVAYILGGEGAAKMLNFALLVVVTFVIRHTARRWLPETQATLWAALFASTPLVQLVTGSLFVENVWAAVILGGVLTLIEGELIWAGILLGTGLAVKLGTIAYIAPAVVLGAVVAVRRKKATQAALALVLLVVFAAPTYVTAWRKTGNPVYPFMNQIFKAPSFDASTPLEDSRYRALLSWRTLYDITFRTDKYYEAQKGGMGFQYFLLLIPAALMARRRESRLLLAIGAAAAILTLRSEPNVRYLYPALPLFSIGLAETPIGWAMAGVTALNVWFLPASGWYDKDFAVFRRDRRDAYVKSVAPQRALTEYLNRNAPGEPAAYFDGDLTAGLLGQPYTDTWHSYAYWWELRKSENADQLIAAFRRRHIRYVVAPVSGESYFPAARELFLRWMTAPLATAGTLAVYGVRDAPKEIPRPARPFDGTPVPPGDYDDMSHSIEYEGIWASGQYSMASGSTLTYSHGADDTAGLSFNGSGIEYWYTAAFNRGIAQVLIDGREKARVDLYAPRIRWQQKTALLGLGPGQHTIEIHVLKEKNSRSSDYFVDLDKFVVTP
jgi:hypothetical protein